MDDHINAFGFVEMKEAAKIPVLIKQFQKYISYFIGITRLHTIHHVHFFERRT